MNMVDTDVSTTDLHVHKYKSSAQQFTSMKWLLLTRGLKKSYDSLFDSFSYDQYQLILSYMYTTETNQIIFLIWVNVIQNNIQFLSCFYNYFKTD